jgi:methionyl-tRNA formyltransferase
MGINYKKMKIVFMGTPAAAVPTLEKIITMGHEVVAVWTQPDRPAGRGNKVKAPPVKEYAEEAGIPVFQPEKIRTKKTIELFKSHQADVAVVVAYGRILSKSYLSAFKMGCINVHFSLLPKYRGAAPVNWAIVKGEEKTGITTMQMDLGLDTGDILLQSETVINKDENAIQLMDRLAHSGAQLLAETLENYENITPLAQNNDLATFAPLMSKDDGLIDWSKSSQEIVNQIRGFQPFPKSFTTYQGTKLTLWEAAISENPETLEQASKTGEIIMAHGDDLIINCGENTFVNIDELQIAGKRRMNTRDFLNGIKLEVGKILG